MVENVKVTGTKKENKILAWAKKHKTGLLVAAGSIAGAAIAGAVGYSFGKKQSQTPSISMIEITGDVLEKIRADHKEFEEEMPGYLGEESYILETDDPISLNGYSKPVITVDVTGFSVEELSENSGGKIFDDPTENGSLFMVHTLID